MSCKIENNFEIYRYGLKVRLVTEDDAAFIVSIRTNRTRSEYIGATSTDVEDQRQWIRDYKLMEALGEDYYFIFMLDNKPLGVYRLYDIKGEDFVCGSWVFSPDAPKGAAILGCIIGREIAYEELQLTNCYTDVIKGNNSSMQFQMAFKPEILREDETKVYFRHYKKNFYQIKPQLILLCSKLLK